MLQGEEPPSLPELSIEEVDLTQLKKNRPNFSAFLQINPNLKNPYE